LLQVEAVVVQLVEEVVEQGVIVHLFLVEQNYY
jgi:hypothetical protein